MFSTHNCYYLRLSAHALIPVHLYLDERHTQWMSSRVLQMVLTDLRPLIVPKLVAEHTLNLGPGSAKKGTVDVLRGDTYQFAYFLRKVEPHNVVIKTRNFVPTPIKVKQEPPPESVPKATGRERKRKRSTATPTDRAHAARREVMIPDDDAPDDSVGRSLRRRPRDKSRPLAENEDNDAGAEPSDDDLQGDPDYTLAAVAEDQPSDDLPMPAELEDQPPAFVVDEADEKPKLAVRLKFQGFEIAGRCLCVVVEPWPSTYPVSAAQNPAPRSITSSAEKELRRTPATSQTSLREATPLFLPDDEEDLTTFASTSNRSHPRERTPVAFRRESSSAGRREDEDNFQILQFSQMLQNTGGDRGGSDSESDSGALMGDADEYSSIL